MVDLSWVSIPEIQKENKDVVTYRMLKKPGG